MATYNIEINQRANKHGLYRIYIRITHDRKLKRIKTEVEIPLEHFNPIAKWGKWIRASNSKHAKFNSDIESQVEDLKAKAKSAVESGLPVLIELSKPTEQVVELTLKVYFEKILKDMEVEASYVHWRGTKSKLTVFQKFIGENKPVSILDVSHIKSFKIFLLEKKLNNVTVNTYMARINHCLKPAVESGLLEKDPFRTNKPLKELPSKKQRLSDAQIALLENLELRVDRKINWPFLSRNLYLFSYYNAGIRIKDLLQLRNSNIKSDNRLEYEMDKTGHIKSIPLSKAALKILAIYFNKDADPNHYLFPILENNAPYAEFITYQEKKKMDFSLRRSLFNAISSHTSQVNNSLKFISEKIKLTSPITFHTSRHSFAEKARRSMKKSSKVTLYDIKNALGHKSIVTTEKYMNSFDKESLDEAMNDIFE